MLNQTPKTTPSDADAETAVRTLLAWLGEDPEREGLSGTPDRVVRSWREMFAGYGADVADILSTTFEEVDGYAGMVLLAHIPFVSHCEHHILPFHGHAHVAYLPAGRVVGLSKLARLVDVYARRLQIQERMTVQIATALETALQPRGVAVVVDAHHMCMSARGVGKAGSSMRTSQFTGAFETDAELRNAFYEGIRTGG
jgi:GTP cyclohydrolase I